MHLSEGALVVFLCSGCIRGYGARRGRHGRGQTGSEALGAQVCRLCAVCVCDLNEPDLGGWYQEHRAWRL